MDKVAIIAPSSKGNPSNLPTIKEYVEALDFSAHISENIYSNDNPFYSNSDEFRANDLITALTDDSKIIWCIRGGKGAPRLIPYLEGLPDDIKAKIALNKKIFIGYSDITALHIYLQVKYNWQTLHGVMLEAIVSDTVDKHSIDKLIALIQGRQNVARFDNLKPIHNGAKLKNGSLESKIIGGNLTLVEDSIGTLWQINTKAKILFLENVKVEPYQIERSLDHLKQAHILDDVDAVIFGDFIDCTDIHQVEMVQERFAQSVRFPVFTMQGIGHGFRSDPLPLNTPAIIRAQNNKEELLSMDVQNINFS